MLLELSRKLKSIEIKNDSLTVPGSVEIIAEVEDDISGVKTISAAFANIEKDLEKYVRLKKEKTKNITET